MDLQIGLPTPEGGASAIRPVLPRLPVPGFLPHRRRDHRAGRGGGPPAGRPGLPGRRGRQRAEHRLCHRDPRARRFPLRAPGTGRRDRRRHRLRGSRGPALPAPQGGRWRAHRARSRGPGVPGHPGSHARVDLHRGVGVTRRGRPVRCADRRHAVHRGCRPPGPARRPGPKPRGHGPPALPVAAYEPAHAARRHPGLPGSRGGVRVRQEPVHREGLDHRRAAPQQLRAAAGQCRGLRDRGHRGPAAPARLLRPGGRAEPGIAPAGGRRGAAR